jgi:hypothetical protein
MCVAQQICGCGIISKLPPSWRDFATKLKHKRELLSVAKLIGSLDVEESARAKDIDEKVIKYSCANMMHRKNSNASHIKKKKNNKQNTNKPKQAATLKKKNEQR